MITLPSHVYDRNIAAIRLSGNLHTETQRASHALQACIIVRLHFHSEAYLMKSTPQRIIISEKKGAKGL